MTTQPLAQDYTVVMRAPDAGRIVAGGGLVRTPGGALLATVPLIDWRTRTHPNEVHVLRSDDGGATWEPLGAPLPYYTVTPWVHGGAVYLFAHTTGAGKYRNDDLLLLRSEDDGETCGEPVTLFEGHYWNCPTAMVVRGDTLYRAMDRMDVDGRAMVVIAGDLSRDPMDAATWRISNDVAYPGTPPLLTGRVFPAGAFPGLRADLWLEPNVVDIHGRLRVLVRCDIDGRGTTGICGVCGVDDDGRDLRLSFVQFHPFPGAQCKFHIVDDGPSGLYWTAVNLPTDAQDTRGRGNALRAQGFLSGTGNERRFLMLQYSADCLTWFQAGCVARWPSAMQGFQYAAPLVDGDDLLLLVRTARDAPNQHDAELMTFHRVKSFRDLAMDLSSPPDAERG